MAPTTSSQNGSTPKPGIASRASPGSSSHCRPSTMNSSRAVPRSTPHTIGGARDAGGQAFNDVDRRPAATTHPTEILPQRAWNGFRRRSAIFLNGIVKTGRKSDIYKSIFVPGEGGVCVSLLADKAPRG
jgi:hypothetical protein